jgi:TIR domain
MKIYRSIKELVIDAYNSESAMPSYEKLTALVREYFPNSKWQKTHYVWYKSQIKTGRISIANVTKQSENTTSDIFISYKREEQATARKLADALESEGWTVWWDPKLRAGEHFDDVIEKALKEAKCVIVLWSNLSVNSEYVKAEATEALEQKKLVPIKIESVDLPFRFKRVHTPSLLGWNGSNDAPGFRKLVEDIAAIVKPSATEAKRKANEAKERNHPQQELRKGVQNSQSISHQSVKTVPLEITIVKDRLDMSDKHLFFQVWLDVNNQSDSSRFLYRLLLEPIWIKSRQGGKQLDVIEPSPSTAADWYVRAHSKESRSVIFPFELAQVGGGVARQPEIGTYQLLAEDNAGHKYTIRKDAEVERVWTVP